MKKPYYLVVSKFWRREVPNIHNENHNQIPLQADLVENTKKFEHKNLLEARKQAFTHYNSILEVLYDGLQKSKITDVQARLDLQHYLDSGNGIILGNGNIKINSLDIHNRIEINWVCNRIKKPIHGIYYLEDVCNWDDDLEVLFDNLTEEFQYYQKNNLAHFNQIETIRNSTPKTIIKTPVNWKEIFKKKNNY